MTCQFADVAVYQAQIIREQSEIMTAVSKKNEELECQISNLGEDSGLIKRLRRERDHAEEQLEKEMRANKRLKKDVEDAKYAQQDGYQRAGRKVNDAKAAMNGALTKADALKKECELLKNTLLLYDSGELEPGQLSKTLPTRSVLDVNTMWPK